MEIPPGNFFGSYAVQLKITDSQGRTTEALFHFTAAGNAVPEPTASNYRELFKKATTGMPSDWQVHHVMQQRLAKRYWDERRINVHRLSNLRGVPASVHSEITAAQNVWWAQMKAKHNWTPANIPLEEVDAFNANLDTEFSSRWVSHGAPKSQITAVKNLVKNKAAAQFGLDKANRWQRLGLAVTAFGFFNLISANAKAFESMRTFNPDTHVPFKRFMSNYEGALEENIAIGRVKRKTGEVLTKSFIDFGRSINLDADALNKIDIAMNEYTAKKLHE